MTRSKKPGGFKSMPAPKEHPDAPPAWAMNDPRSNEWTHPEGDESRIENEPCANCGLHFGPEHYTDNRGADNVCDACKRHIRDREKCPDCGVYVTGGEVCEGCIAYREHQQ